MRGNKADGPSKVVRVTWTSLTLAGLLAHSAGYRFLCDDAFISFRYARNLSRGFGLVFNPGRERVEGYTNFLWVLVLAALDRVGLVPERAAIAGSLVATVFLWALVVWFARRSAPERGVIVLLPAVLLAATRSVAVWSTSGLETRLFEVLLIGGVLRCTVELEPLPADGKPRRALAGWLFGLAALTRPDALVVAVPVLLASVALLRARGRLDRRWLVGTALPFVTLIGAHLAFRLAYYGDWLPNTYYAKLAGRLRWDWGLPYLGACVLEYGAWLWLPLVVAGVQRYRRTGRGHVPLLFGVATLPVLVYVASIGGDHFEYRVLDLLFPLAFLVMGEGFLSLSEARSGRARVVLAAVVVLVGLIELPLMSHFQFSRRYTPGFPGAAESGTPNREEFLAPDRDLVFRFPILRSIAAEHRSLTRYLTSHFVAVRQEEHRLFLEKAAAQGRRLRDLVVAGLVPSDTRIAVDCVGAIPYYSDLVVLDRHGLTDGPVAHQKRPVTELLAHEKVADLADARRFGVELWAEDPVELVLPITAQRLLFVLTHPAPDAPPVYVAPVDPDEFLVCMLPAGLEHARQRMPRLRWTPILDSAFAAAYVRRATPAFDELLRHEPDDVQGRNCLAFLLLVQGRFAEALEQYTLLAAARPGDAIVWERIAFCARQLGRSDRERQALEHLLELARARGDGAAADGIQRRLGMLGTP